MKYQAVVFTYDYIKTDIITKILNDWASQGWTIQSVVATGVDYNRVVVYTFQKESEN